MKQIMILMTCFIIASGCASVPDIDKPLPGYNWVKEEPYELDTTSLEMPDAPDFILLKETDDVFRIVEDDGIATHVAITQDDLTKIDAMLTIKNTYRDISTEQAALINVERDKINALKELLTIERDSRQLERTLRFDTEKELYRERREHRIDNVISRITSVVAIVGGVMIATL